jgi:carbonic anhydrase
MKISQNFTSLKNDLPSGLVVFLIALPLCLGVALASGAPLISGIMSGIIGGVVVGFISKSPISVSGPAAGLSAVVLASIHQLGSFDVFLMALLLSGIFQLILGLLKTGFIANYIPSNVINGLLAAIGIILILKQIPHAVGFDRDTEEDFSFFQRDGENTFSELLNIFTYFSWGAVILTALSLLILIFWNKTALAKLKFLPASLVVVLFGIVLNFIFKQFIPSFYITEEHMVNIPRFSGFSELIVFPSFTDIFNYKVWIVAATIAIISSLETLLNLEALENFDSKKRKSFPNNELIAQGAGNVFSGLFGGIPITSVVVRSTVNINAGAVSKMSTIFHGVLLLFSCVLFAPFINNIPFASLACILLVTGYKLCEISIFKKMYKKGWNQFIPFMVTIIAIVFSDLLIGILIGSAVSVLFLLKSNLENPFNIEKGTQFLYETMRVELPNQITFLNKAGFKQILLDIPNNTKFIIDGSHASSIDHDVVESILDFKDNVAKAKNIQLNIIGLDEKFGIGNQIQFSMKLNKMAQQTMDPELIVNVLKNGNQRFVAGKSTEKYMKLQLTETSEAQNPFAIVLSCIDSRTSNEHVFDLGLGDIFSIRIAGNVLNNDILGSLEYGVHAIGVRLVVVLGHTKCGAIIGACNGLKMGHLSQLLEKIEPAIDMQTTIIEHRDGSNLSFVNDVAQNNVILTIERIKNESEIVASLIASGQVKIIGGLYDIETGIVTFF